MRFRPLAIGFFAVAAMAAACGNGGSTQNGFADAGAACTPGDSTGCTCGDGNSGTKLCTTEGEFGACSCHGALPPVEAGAAVCGNGTCDQGETCKDCPSDCGDCPACNEAPSCSQGLALPSQTEDVKFDDLGKPLGPNDADAGDAGDAAAHPAPSTCGDAQLRLRVARVEVGHQGKNVWLPTGTIAGSPQAYYCVVQASDGVVVGAGDAGSKGTVEVALTRPTAAIPDFGGADFAPSDSIFWGQSGPRLTHSNLTITYSCFQQKEAGDSTWQKVLQAAANAAGSLANSGPYGWAFGLGSVGLQVAGAAVAAGQSQGDWHIFDITQTIDRSRLLDLTNGRMWSFTRSGGDHAFQYPWSITVYIESWGCADPLPHKPL